MSKSERISYYQRVILGADYRNLDPIHKAIKLIKEEKANIVDTAAATKVGRKSISRAIQAQEANREIGRSGRPPNFNKVDIGEVLKEIQVIPTTERRTYQRIREEVNMKIKIVWLIVLIKYIVYSSMDS